MPISLKKSVSSNANTDSGDVRHLKQALNRLGYYMPDRRIGISDTADTKLISAVKAFQKDRDLKVDGTLKPDGATLAMINQALAEGPGSMNRGPRP